MNDTDALFEDIQDLSDQADALGLNDVAIVLEFAMDVYLRETGLESPQSGATATQTLERAAQKLKMRYAKNPADMPRTGVSMSTFPLTQAYRVAS